MDKFMPGDIWGYYEKDLKAEVKFQIVKYDASNLTFLIKVISRKAPYFWKYRDGLHYFTVGSSIYHNCKLVSRSKLAKVLYS